MIFVTTFFAMPCYLVIGPTKLQYCSKMWVTTGPLSNPVKQAAMQKEVEYLLEIGFALHSSSSSSLLLVEIWTNSLFDEDYCKMKAVTKPDSLPLLCMDDYVDRVGSVKYITRLDLLKRYWQAPLSPCESKVSAVVTWFFPPVYSHVFWVKKRSFHFPKADD